MVSALPISAAKSGLRKGKSLVKTASRIPLSQVHEEYLRCCLVEGIRPLTVKTYTDDLRPWLRWCTEKGILYVDEVKTAHALEYLSEERKRGLSDRTVRNRAIVLKSALKYAYRQGYLTSERLYGWKLPQATKPAVYMATQEECKTIYEAIGKHWSAALNPNSRFRNQKARTFFTRRDQAIFSIQLSVGLRITETLSLTLEDYSKERGELYVKHSKTGRPRAVPVTPALASLIAAWLAVRPAGSPSQFLFVTEYGEQLHQAPWSRQFQRYLDFARTQGHPLPRITLSSLRHVAATAMATTNLYHASLLLGHSSTRVTEASYVHRKTEIIRATHEAADPLAGILVNARRESQRRKKIV